MERSTRASCEKPPKRLIFPPSQDSAPLSPCTSYTSFDTNPPPPPDLASRGDKGWSVGSLRDLALLSSPSSNAPPWRQPGVRWCFGALYQPHIVAPRTPNSHLVLRVKVRLSSPVYLSWATQHSSWYSEAPPGGAVNGQIDGFFSQLLFKCYLPEVASAGD
jgi:hypothetical protein